MPPSQVPTAVPCGMSRTSLLTSLGGLLAGGAGLVLLATGCGSSHPRSTPPASTTTTTDPAAAAVLAAYRAGWAAFEEAVDTGNPALPSLADTMTGVQLNSVRRILVADQANGIIGRGSVQLRPKVQSITGNQAVVVDCAFDSSELVYAKTGKPVPPITPPEKVAVRAQLTEVAPGTWKVASQQTNGGSCPPDY